MPRRVCHIDRIISATAVEVLCPRIIRIATVAVLREETGGGGVVVPHVHVQQARGIRYATRERHLVEERIAAGRHAAHPGGERMRLPPGGVVFSVRHAVVKVLSVRALVSAALQPSAIIVTLPQISYRQKDCYSSHAAHAFRCSVHHTTPQHFNRSSFDICCRSHPS